MRNTANYKDAVKAIGLSGIEGLAKIQSIMETLRNNTPTEVGGYKVTSARDYKLDTIKKYGNRRSKAYRTSFFQRSLL